MGKSMGRRRFAAWMGLMAAGVIGTFAASAKAQSPDGWVVQGDTLYQVNMSFGTRTALTPTWTGSTSMVYDHSGVLHIIQGSILYKVSAWDGTWTGLGTAQWGGETQMAWNSTTSSLYVVQDTHLHRLLNPYVNDSYSVLGGAIWSGTTSMTSLGSSLYIIRSGTLYRVDPTTGSRTSLGSVWGGATRMVAMDPDTPGGPQLFIVQNSRLHRVNPATGAYVVLGNPEWGGTTSMFCTNSGAVSLAEFGIIQNDRLHRVTPAGGDWTVIGSPVWTGPTVSVGRSCL